jgi:hypothetical protein
VIRRFIKITNNLYRGSAPTVQDVKDLHNKFGIRKIVSLDAMAGHKINRICKLLGIEHIIIPIDMVHLEPIAKLLSYNLYDLLIEGGPTFVHCIEGKDRPVWLSPCLSASIWIGPVAMLLMRLHD